ncbi:MAG: hypothetical protein KDB14_33020 [Planctomycetales bacterium]|nr:hypothetical protein [Planctomycetales bacterium]
MSFHSRLALPVALAFAFTCFTPPPASAAGQPAAIDAAAKSLEGLGGVVTRKDGKVVEVSFRDSKSLGPEQWRQLGQLSDLAKLTVYGGAKGLNDTTVSHLTGLRHLEQLSTDGARLSDRGLEKLAELKSLRSVAFFHLSFRMEGFTGKGFAAWRQLPHLERLTVAGMSMGDEGFAAIAQIASLRELRTWHTYRTEASNQEIAKLPLRSLKVGQRLPGAQRPPCLSNQSLPVLASIATLETLELGEARLDLAGLRAVAKLPKLQRLKIDRTEITEAEIEQLRTLLPNVKIDFEPLTEEQRSQLNRYLP